MLDVARPSARLEALRAALHPESAHGHAHPPALLLAFGDAGPCGHRAAFATDFLGCAGIRVEGPLHVDTADEMTAAVRRSESPIILLCGPEDAFVVFGAAARNGLGGRHAGATLVAVGRPPDDDPGRWFVDSSIDRDTPLLAGLGRILSAAGLRFEGERV
jgi:methylmalonyl-CoA mutase cobalamin-binding subunit